jgi:hypothetical protein
MQPDGDAVTTPAREGPNVRHTKLASPDPANGREGTNSALADRSLTADSRVNKDRNGQFISYHQTRARNRNRVQKVHLSLLAN